MQLDIRWTRLYKSYRLQRKTKRNAAKLWCVGTFIWPARVLHTRRRRRRPNNGRR